MRFQLKLCLYAISALTDFAFFVVVFAVSRGLADAKVEPVYLGVVGAGLALCQGIGSVLGGWLASRFDNRIVFLVGTFLACASLLACALLEIQSPVFLACYWFQGIGLGTMYPPLIGWLNQGEVTHANQQGVSRTLILFCIAWNLGMMCGQLTAGELYSWGRVWTFGTACGASLLILILAVIAARLVVPVAALPLSPVPAEHDPQELATAFKRLSWLANLGGMFGGSLVIHLFPDLAVAIGIPPDQHGKLLACWRLVVVATYLILHCLSFWHYRLSVAIGSQLLAAAGLVVMARADSWYMLLLGLAMLGQLVGFNYFAGLFYSTVGSSDEGRALAAGIHEATIAAGMAVGTIVGGVIGTTVNHRAPYLLAAGVMVLLIVAQSIAYWIWIAPIHRRRAAACSTLV